jgi:DNA-binding MarR family transcriptional regulator
VSADDHPLEEYVRVAELRARLRRFLRKSERVARRNGLTPQRYLLLLMVKGAPAGDERASVTELADRLQLAQSTVTELVGRAEEAGLVVRETSRNDARVAYVRLTGLGEQRLTQAFDSLEGERSALRDTLREL